MILKVVTQLILQARQKIYDYRNNIKKAALAIFRQRLLNENCFGDEQAEFAGWLIEDTRYIFENKEEVWILAFRNMIVT